MNNTYYFTTHFDKNYIPRASVMIDSLQKYLPEAILFILAMDAEVETFFSKKNKIIIIHIKDLENLYPELFTAKKNRSPVEFLFTISPFLPLYILEKFDFVKRITSLDADLCFYSSPKNYLDDLGEYIGITPHGFGKDLQRLVIYGKYNVSFQSFPKNEMGINCLKKWANDCIEYCGDHIDEKGRFADQKYLDYWKNDFPIKEFPSPYIGMAPWNVKHAKLEYKNNQLSMNNNPIVFYHFQGFRIISDICFSPGLKDYKVSISPLLKKIYTHYWKELSFIQSAGDDNIQRTNIKKEKNDNTFSYYKRILSDKEIGFSFFNTIFYIDITKYFWIIRKAKEIIQKQFKKI